MKTYVVLLRGINVGGKNTIPMKELKLLLEELGFAQVKTLLNSGNVVLQSDLDQKQIGEKIEKGIVDRFKLDSSIIRVLVLSHKELKAIIDNKPKGFGDEPEKYYSDAIFLMGISSKEAINIFSPREGVDTVWQGNGVIYSQRLTAELTKSRLSKIVGTPLYRSMTILSWNTTTKLLKLLEEIATEG